MGSGPAFLPYTRAMTVAVLARRANASADPLMMVVMGVVWMANTTGAFEGMSANDVVGFGSAAMMIAGGVRVWVVRVMNRAALDGATLDQERLEPPARERRQG